MNPKRIVAGVLFTGLLAWGSHGKAALPLAGHGPAPLLYVRFAGPAGAQLTFHQGITQGRAFDLPITVGLRPGYIYRVKLTRFPEHPEVALYPTLEVRGTLQLPANLRPADYPAPLVLSEDDVSRALAGGVVTKVIYLERPDRAQAVAASADQPLETAVEPGLDPLTEARALGRPMLILRLGGRTFSPEEMAHQSIPGTVLLPGDKVLVKPPVRPWMPWACLPVYDPIAGPRPPEEECLHDGGDTGVPAGLDQEGRLHGLDPADTLAEYTDSHGRKHLAVSNRVCLCVPHFAVVSAYIAPAGYESSVALGSAQTALAQAVIRTKQPGLEARQSVQVAAVRGRERPSGTQASVGTLPVAQLQGRAVVIGRFQEQTVVGTLVEKIPQPPDRPLVLCKSVDKQAVRIGETVTFYLKYTNTGGQPMTDVVVSDSLTGRLEYVPGSAKSDRAVVFKKQENEAGSLILRWEVAGRLLPGQSGVVSFQARVR